MAYTYGNATATGIRRQLDIDKDCISLAKLLFEIKKEPQLVKRADYISITIENQRDVEMIERWEKKRLNKEFSEMAGSGECLDQEIIDRDFYKIEKENNRSVKKVVAFVDWFIAHHDKRQERILLNNEKPLFKELHSIIDDLHELFEKYHLLVTGGSFQLYDHLHKEDIEREVAAFFNTISK